MAGFGSYRALGDAFDQGQWVTSHFRKAPSNTTIANWWFDLSMASGNPPPQYYAAPPLEAAVLNGFRGVFRGDDVSPATKWLTELMLVTPTAGFVGRWALLDYLLYYPFVDGDSTDTQEMVNTVTLPRFESGDGVQVMAVCLAPTVGGGTFTFDYVNQDGVAATSPVQTCTTTAANIGSLVTSQPASAAAQGPFLLLNPGDTGVRSVTSLTMTAVSGGLFSLVLVKPLCDHVVREINTASEAFYVGPRSPGVRVEDGAYLNFIVQTAATVAGGTVTGLARFAWN